MVTYSDLFTFVIMLCAVITLVVTIFRHKKQHPLSGKLSAIFYNTYLPAARCALAIGSLVKYIIVNSIKYVNYLRSFSHAGRQKMKGRSYMPTYKDEKTGTWFVKCYYTDYIGNKKQKKKRGFARQKDAKEWEYNFFKLPTIRFNDHIRQYCG